jgi:hypothetical protein
MSTSQLRFPHNCRTNNNLNFGLSILKPYFQSFTGLTLFDETISMMKNQLRVMIPDYQQIEIMCKFIQAFDSFIQIRNLS